mgnify:CR=1 FL=1
MIGMIRNGVAYEFEPSAFQAWLESGGGLAPADLLLDTAGEWHVATSFPSLSPYLPPSTRSSDQREAIGITLLKVGLIAVSAVALYKVGQALFDQDYGGRAFPPSFRAEKIQAHLNAHGPNCLSCQRRVRVRELTLDHIYPWAKGGLTSRFNAEVICGRCNSSKGANANFLDYVRGRAT